MSVATSTAVAIGLGVSGAAALGGAALSSGAASNAASSQAGAAEQAAELQHEDAQAALQWQQQMFGTQMGLAMPWITSGQNSLNELNQLMGLPNASSGTPTAGNFPGTVPGEFPGGTNPFLGSSFGSSTGQFNPLASMSSRIMDPNGTTGVPNGRMIDMMNGSTGPDARLGLPSDMPVPVGQHTPPVQMNGGPAVATTMAPGLNGNPAPSNTNSYLQPFTNWTQQFQAPTALTEQNDPGYLARLNLQTQALQNSAAARGTLLTGGTAKDIGNAAQDYASNEYGNVYNRALTEYQQNYNIFQNQQATQFNRLAALAGYGQTGVGQLNSAGTAAANNAGNILLGSGAQIGQNINNAAAARASGYVGSANAYSGMFNNLGNLAMMYGMFNQGGGSNPAAAFAGGVSPY